MQLSLCTVDYSLDFDADPNYPILHLFCRDNNNKRVVVKVKDFEPYFYIQKKDFKLIEFDFLDFIKKYDYGYQDLFDNELVRIYTFTPPQVGKMRKALRDMRIKTYEADILFPLRYLIDNKIFSGIDYDIYNKTVKSAVESPSRFRILAIDIEVYDADEKEIEEYIAPIIVYGIYDSFTDSYYIYTLKDIKESELKEFLIEKDKTLKIIKCKTELALLKKVSKFIKSLEPDIIFTFSPWDMNYTIRRMEHHKKNWSRTLSPMRIARPSSDREAKISGVQCLDIAEMYGTTLRKARYETLEFIAEQELKIEALHHDERVYEMWDNDYKMVLQRNLRDVELVKLLNDELQLITYFDTIRRVTGCNLSDTLLRSRVADVLDLREAREINRVLPTRRFYRHIDYEGAKVFKAKSGVYNNVLVVDVGAMYPSIIRALNIGYMSFVPGKFEERYFEIKDLKGMFNITDIPSFVIKALDKLEPLRMPHKKKAKEYPGDSREHKYHQAVADGLKSVCNAEYGKFGHSGDWKKYRPASRLYEPRIAAAITYVGRLIQERMYEYLEDKGYSVIMGDTDSVFFTISEEDNIEEILDMLNKFIKKILKDELDAKALLELEKDKLFTSLVVLTKKRYGGKKEDGTYEFKGMEIVKRDQPIVTVQIQEGLLKKVLNGSSKKEIRDYFIEYCDNFNSKTVEEIAIQPKVSKKPEQFKSPSYHLKAFVYSKDILNIPLEIGRRFYLVYVNEIPDEYPNVFTLTTKEESKQYNVEAIGFRKADEIPKGFKVDYEKMLEKTIMNKSSDILYLININLDVIKKRVKGYMSIDNWFGDSS